MLMDAIRRAKSNLSSAPAIGGMDRNGRSRMRRLHQPARISHHHDREYLL